MPRRKLNYHEKQYMRTLEDEVIVMRENIPARLRNAVYCLAACDPHWIDFIEKEAPSSIQASCEREYLQLIESRARAIVLKKYSFFGRKQISPLIFRENWYFTDDGNLSAG